MMESFNAGSISTKTYNYFELLHTSASPLVNVVEGYDISAPGWNIYHTKLRLILSLWSSTTVHQQKVKVYNYLKNYYYVLKIIILLVALRALIRLYAVNANNHLACWLNVIQLWIRVRRSSAFKWFTSFEFWVTLSLNY